MRTPISASSMMQTRWMFSNIAVSQTPLSCVERGSAVILEGPSEGMAHLPAIIDCDWLHSMLSPRQSCSPCLALESRCELPKRISVVRFGNHDMRPHSLERNSVFNDNPLSISHSQVRGSHIMSNAIEAYL